MSSLPIPHTKASTLAVAWAVGAGVLLLVTGLIWLVGVPGMGEPEVTEVAYAGIIDDARERAARAQNREADPDDLPESAPPVNVRSMATRLSIPTELEYVAIDEPAEPEVADAGPDLVVTNPGTFGTDAYKEPEPSKIRYLGQILVGRTPHAVIATDHAQAIVAEGATAELAAEPGTDAETVSVTVRGVAAGEVSVEEDGTARTIEKQGRAAPVVKEKEDCDEVSDQREELLASRPQPNNYKGDDGRVDSATYRAALNEWTAKLQELSIKTRECNAQREAQGPDRENPWYRDPERAEAIAAAESELQRHQQSKPDQANFMLSQNLPDKQAYERALNRWQRTLQSLNTRVEELRYQPPR